MSGMARSLVALACSLAIGCTQLPHHGRDVDQAQRASVTRFSESYPSRKRFFSRLFGASLQGEAHEAVDLDDLHGEKGSLDLGNMEEDPLGRPTPGRGSAGSRRK